MFVGSINVAFNMFLQWSLTLTSSSSSRYERDAEPEARCGSAVSCALSVSCSDSPKMPVAKSVDEGVASRNDRNS